MALQCPVDFDVGRLRRAIGDEYTKLVEDPHGEFHFHRGPRYAVDTLRYDREELALLPDEAVERFAGVGNPLRIDRLRLGEVVVDIGSGSGTDSMLAAWKVGPKGRVIGVDPTPAMREFARRNADRAGVGEIVEFREGDAEALPLEDGAADVVISNGVLNLTTDKQKAYEEIARVLRPNGRLLLADVVVRRELSLAARSDVALWAA